MEHETHNMKHGTWNMKHKVKNLMFQASSFKFHNEGFTLIEAIVSVSVFAIAMTSIIGVFVAVQRLNAESISLQALQQNGRFVMEDLTKIIRNGRIDYGAYASGVPQPQAGVLNLINQDNENIGIFKQGEELIISKAGVGSSALTGGEVRVLDFKVYIWPATDPFPAGSEQPTVTVFLDLESNINPRDRVRIPFQTTAATRQYPE